MMTTPPEPIVLKCACCGTPIGELQGDVIVFKVKHHGEMHVTAMTVASLQLQKAAPPIDAAHATC
jgi:hypothetical protein